MDPTASAPPPASRAPASSAIASAPEGLRERKKAQTRQRISDVATAMFLERGFDEVRVADIAMTAGVSEKTVFNYFPTKEGLLFDQFDAQLASILTAIRTRPRGTSPTTAYLEELMNQMGGFDEAPDWDHLVTIFPRFAEMIDSTPALRAAWGDHRHAIVVNVAEVLAHDLGVGARDPEPMTMARALVSLTELSYEALQRNVADSHSVSELLARIRDDLERGARLLDTGLWSAAALMDGADRGEGLASAARQAESARRQVLTALRRARRTRRASSNSKRPSGESSTDPR